MSVTQLAPEPAPPVRQYSFTDWQVNNPTAPPPGDRLDAEYDRANTAISQTLNWVSTSLNTDGSLKTGSVGQSQLVSGLFDDIAQDITDELQPLVDEAQGFAAAAAGSSTTAQAAATAADVSNTAAGGAASTATGAANTAIIARNTAQTYALTAQTAADDAGNADNHASGAAALAEDYADVTQAWAEHMPDTIPPNILAVMAVTGDHWSSRWWANQAAQLIRGSINLINVAGIPNASPDGSPPDGAIPGDLYNNGGFLCMKLAPDGTTGPSPGRRVNLSGIPNAAPDGSAPTYAITGDLYNNGGFVCIAP